MTQRDGSPTECAVCTNEVFEARRARRVMMKTPGPGGRRYVLFFCSRKCQKAFEDEDKVK